MLDSVQTYANDTRLIVNNHIKYLIFCLFCLLIFSNCQDNVAENAYDLSIDMTDMSSIVTDIFDSGENTSTELDLNT